MHKVVNLLIIYGGLLFGIANMDPSVTIRNLILYLSFVLRHSVSFWIHFAEHGNRKYFNSFNSKISSGRYDSRGMSRFYNNISIYF